MKVRLGAAVAAVLSVAGCASGPSPGGPVTPIDVENVFISPSGEPFHAGREDPYVSALWFARADADHDGKITRAEFLADAERAFQRYDANHDGVIDGLEIAAYEDKIAPEIQPRVGSLHAGEGTDASLFGGRGGKPSGERGTHASKATAGDTELQGAGLYALLPEPEPLSAADADLDGKVTRTEWRVRSDRRFDLLANGATAITMAALPKTEIQKLLQRRQAKLKAARSAGGSPGRP